MKEYLLSAVGVIFLSVIVSLIVPDGKLNKTIVFIMRMVCIFVLIQPVSGIFKITDADIEEPIFDYVYISKVYSDNQSEQLEKIIKAKFGTDSECEVVIGYDNGQFKVQEVKVGLLVQDKEIIDKIYAYLEESKYINITVYAKSN